MTDEEKQLYDNIYQTKEHRAKAQGHGLYYQTDIEPMPCRMCESKTQWMVADVYVPICSIECNNILPRVVMLHVHGWSRDVLIECSLLDVATMFRTAVKTLLVSREQIIGASQVYDELVRLLKKKFKVIDFMHFTPPSGTVTLWSEDYDEAILTDMETSKWARLLGEDLFNALCNHNGDAIEAGIVEKPIRRRGKKKEEEGKRRVTKTLASFGQPEESAKTNP